MSRISVSTQSVSRVAAWFRRDYPPGAPARGHCALIALCGTNARGSAR